MMKIEEIIRTVFMATDLILEERIIFGALHQKDVIYGKGMVSCIITHMQLEVLPRWKVCFVNRRLAT